MKGPAMAAEVPKEYITEYVQVTKLKEKEGGAARRSSCRNRTILGIGSLGVDGGWRVAGAWAKCWAAFNLYSAA